MDFLLHAVAFSDKNELKGRYADTTRENFSRTMVISCFAFTEAAKRAARLMPNGGAMLTLTYNGGERAMPNYNTMGLAKAALESSVRYLAVDFGRERIRVNAIRPARSARSPAPGSATRARCSRSSRSIPRSAAASRWRTWRRRALSALRPSAGVTGEIHFVDSGYNVIAMPHPDALKVENGTKDGGG